LTLYDAQHFFVPNEIKRYSLGTKNNTLKSPSIYVQADRPPEAQRTNWLPGTVGRQRRVAKKERAMSAFGL
jgi:hypothetical protein